MATSATMLFTSAKKAIKLVYMALATMWLLKWQDHFLTKTDNFFTSTDLMELRLLKTHTHVEQFGATGKTCCHVLNSKIRKRYISYQYMFCQVSLPVSFNDEGMNVISILRSLVWQMFTPLPWKVLTEPINFVLISQVILLASGTTTFFRFYLT